MVLIVGKTKNALKKRIWIILIIVLGCGIVIGILFYPLYVRYVAVNYAREFATVLNSHDIKKYDAFFEKDTVFKYGGKEITYADVREQLAKNQNFESADSYGHLEENIGIFCTKEYRVSLMLPISTYDDEFSGIVEGWFVLQRKCMLFFEIKEVEIYEIEN